MRILYWVRSQKSFEEPPHVTSAWQEFPALDGNKFGGKVGQRIESQICVPIDRGGRLK